MHRQSRAALRLIPAIAGFLAALAPAQEPRDADPTRPTGRHVWRGPKAFDPLVAVPAAPAPLAADDSIGLWIVQADRAPDDAFRNAIRAAGGRPTWYVPENGYAVRIDAAGAARLAGGPGVRWVGPLEPAWRLEPALLPIAARGGAGLLRLVVLLVDRATDGPTLAARVDALGGRARVDADAGSPTAEVDLPAAALAALARLDEVIWIERWSPAEPDMDNARIQGGGDHVETVGGFRGQGVVGHVHEGVEETHPDFTNTPQVLMSTPVADAHGHATAGIVFGNGSSNPRVRGMAPDASFYYTNYATQSVPWTMRGPVLQSALTFGAMFTTASWGNDRTIYYTAISADSDQAVFDHRLPWTQSQSNAGNAMSRPQAWAKNVISVGGVQHGDNANALDDSWRRGGASTGPAADGRIKPDLCAYYDAIGTSDLSGSSGYSSGNWTGGFGGTSGATPIVAGHNALAIQMFTDGAFGNALRVPGGTRFQNRPRATTLKALMIAAARQYDFTASSSDNRREHQGWGFPDLRAMHDDRAVMRIVDESDVVTAGQTQRYTIRVAPGRSSLKAVLTWADPAGLPNAPTGASVLVNDLDLRLIDPTGRSYFGNVGLTTGVWSSSGGAADRVDSVECVFVANPPAGDWTLEVVAVRIAQDGRPSTPATDTDFGLVIRGGIDPFQGGGDCRAAHSVDDQPGVGSCNFVPFGSTRGSATANQKYQTVVSGSALGRLAGDITALAFASCGTGVRTHDRIRIRMSHVPSGYALVPTFAQNLPNPVTVLDTTNWTWSNERVQWSRIGLMAPFAYDGRSDVVVELELQGSDFAATPSEFRSGPSARVVAFGWTGAPPADGSLLTSGALKMRFEFDCASVTRLGRGCAPVSMTWQGQPELGGGFTVGVRSAVPNWFAYLNFGYDNRPPLFPLDLRFAGVPGCMIWHDALAVVRVSTDARGEASLALQIPNIPAIAGGSMFVQAAVTDTSLPGGAATSDYLRCVFGN